MKIIFYTILTFFLVSCGEKQETIEDAGNDVRTSNAENEIGLSDAGSDLSESCSLLNETGCEQDANCLPIFGSPYDYANKCLQPKAFAYCATQPVECNNGLEGLLYDPSTSNCWVQGAACVPSGWLNFIDEDPSFPKDCLEAQEVSDCP